MTADQFLFNTPNHPKGPQALPTFVIRQDKVFTTEHHSDGADPRPWYEVRGGKLHPTAHHPQRAAVMVPWYRIDGNRVYADEGHPHGVQKVHWFELRAEAAPRIASAAGEKPLFSLGPTAKRL